MSIDNCLQDLEAHGLANRGTSRCTGRFDTVPGQLGAQLHGHCVGCLRMTSTPGPMTPIFAGPKFDGECKFKLMEDV